MNNMIIDIRTRFEQELQAKTAWGKNEVMHLYDKVIIQVQSEYLAKLTNKS